MDEERNDKCARAYDYIFFGVEGTESLTVWRSKVDRMIKSVESIKNLSLTIAIGIFMLLAKGVYEHYNPPVMVVTQQTSGNMGGVPTTSTSKTTETQSH